MYETGTQILGWEGGVSLEKDLRKSATILNSYH